MESERGGGLRRFTNVRIGHFEAEKFMNTFRFCPLTLAAAAVFKGHAKTYGAVRFNLLQYGSSSQGGGRGGEGQRETEEAAGGLTSGQQDWTIVLVPW